jgi:uncharacterized protein (TIGR00661 family)
MKIFYAVQATGNGHISRAKELVPELKKYGSVDLFLSGGNSSLDLDAPVKFRSNGLSLYYNCTGGLNYWQIIKGLHPLKLRREINDLPVEDYDLVINDFEYITAASCLKKNIPSIQFGHQAAFLSDRTPRPDPKSSIGEWILRNYAKATEYIGFHFEQYEEYIFSPVVKRQILEAEPGNKGHITVYLPSYCEPQLEKIFGAIPDFQFEIFSKEARQERWNGNIKFIPVHNKLFNQSMIDCQAIITGGGFETPAEALHLGKKMMCIPIKGQYEQLCNIAALEKVGIKCLPKIGDDFVQVFYEWMRNRSSIQFDYSKTVPNAVEYLFSVHEKMKEDHMDKMKIA